MRLRCPARVLLLTCLTGGLALAISPPARASIIKPHRPGKADQQTIFAIEDQIRSALLSADAGSLDKLLADDFLGISANGTLSDKTQYLRRIGRHEHQFSRIDTVERKIRVQPSTAIVTTTVNVIGKLDNTPISGIFRYTRVYARQPAGAWKVINFEATRVSGSRSAGDLSRGEPVSR